MLDGLAGVPPILLGLGGGTVIALLNTVGALAVLAFRRPSQRLLDTALGFAAGVMLAASFTSLILPGIEEYGGLLPVLTGITLGAVVMAFSDRWLPHIHTLITVRSRSRFREGPGAAAVMKPGVRDSSSRGSTSTLLFIAAITMHNLPEGLAVGVGFGSGDLDNALALMLAIGVQNIPEGLAVALAARHMGLGGPSSAAFTGIRAGLVEIPLAVAGAGLVVILAPALPYAMGFAAGAMLFVICSEILPGVHAHGNGRTATLGTMAGVLVMLTLDVALA